MPSITKHRNGSRREAIEQNLLRAVEALLGQGFSYTELPIQKIADEAGIPRSTFYLHFPDKAQLIMRLTERVYNDVFGEALVWWAGDHRDGPAGIAAALERIIAKYRVHFPVLRAVMEVASYEPDVGDAYRARIEEFATGMQIRLEEQRAAGHVHPDVDIEATTKLMCWSTERSITQHIMEDDGSGDARLAQALARAHWLTLYGDAKRPPAPITRGP
jgi:AcrR family transcriptional regulator